MNYSKKDDINDNEFELLIEKAVSLLKDDANKRPDYYIKRNAQLLEEDVENMLNKAATGTKFENTIERKSGQRFPDIIVGESGKFGVEVKSSKDDKWITLGGSINESTRVPSVERIILIFGKLQEPIEFLSRPYEECLDEVVVTHYPRYHIKMNLPKGKTIFDKMNTTYDKLRNEDPVGKIVEYYKSQLSDGESLWWTGKMTEDGIDSPTSVKVKLLGTVSTEKRDELRNIGLALFPDLLSKSSTKYGKFATWLAANQSIVSSSLRDLFSAGGKGKIKTATATFNDVPRIVINIHENNSLIAYYILSMEENILRETWGVDKINNDDRIGQWIDLCVHHNSDVKNILNAIFTR